MAAVMERQSERKSFAPSLSLSDIRRQVKALPVRELDALALWDDEVEFYKALKIPAGPGVKSFKHKVCRELKISSEIPMEMQFMAAAIMYRIFDQEGWRPVEKVCNFVLYALKKEDEDPKVSLEELRVELARELPPTRPQPSVIQETKRASAVALECVPQLSQVEYWFLSLMAEELTKSSLLQRLRAVNPEADERIVIALTDDVLKKLCLPPLFAEGNHRQIAMEAYREHLRKHPTALPTKPRSIPLHRAVRPAEEVAPPPTKAPAAAQAPRPAPPPVSPPLPRSSPSPGSSALAAILADSDSGEQAPAPEPAQPRGPSAVDTSSAAKSPLLEPLVQRMQKCYEDGSLTPRLQLCLDAFAETSSFGEGSRLAAERLGTEQKNISPRITEIKHLVEVPSIPGHSTKDSGKKEREFMLAAWRVFRERSGTEPVHSMDGIECGKSRKGTKRLQQSPAPLFRIEKMVQEMRKFDATRLEAIACYVSGLSQEEMSIRWDMKPWSVGRRVTSAITALGLDSKNRLMAMQVLRGVYPIFASQHPDLIPEVAKDLSPVPPEDGWEILAEPLPSETVPESAQETVSESVSENPIRQEEAPQLRPAPVVRREEEPAAAEAPVVLPHSAPVVPLGSTTVLQSPQTIVGVRVLWSHDLEFNFNQGVLIAEGYRVERLEHFVSFHPVIQATTAFTFVRRR